MVAFESIEEQILLGSLLGDGSLNLPGGCKTPRFREKHAAKQGEYLRWKAENLSSLGPKVRDTTTLSFGVRRPIVSLLTGCKPSLTSLYEAFYSGGTKVVPQSLIWRLTALGLAVWYMDDGTHHQRLGFSCLYTQSFTDAENEWLAERFFPTRFNLYPKVNHRKSNRVPNSKPHSYLKFLKPEAKHLIELVKPHIHPTLVYKMGQS